MSIRLFSIFATAAALGLAGCAQSPIDHAAHQAGASAPGPGQAKPIAHMDEHMKAMRAMHERMSRAKTAEERKALMAEHHKLMQESMAMMGNMQGHSGDPAARHQTMEKRMEIMQSMMQMMMDRLPQ